MKCSEYTVFGIASPTIRDPIFLLIFEYLWGFVSYHPSLKSYGLSRMNDHKNLQAVFVTENIKAIRRLDGSGTDNLDQFGKSPCGFLKSYPLVAI